MQFRIEFLDNGTEFTKVYADCLDLNHADQLVVDGGRMIIPQSWVTKIELE